MVARPGRHWIWYLVSLTVLVVFVHRPLLGSFFVGDDARLLYVGSRVPSWWAILYDREIAVEVDNYFYRPLARFSMWLDWRLFGLNPLGYHLHALGLLFAIGLLLAALLYRISHDSIWACLAAALLVLSPVATITAAPASIFHENLQGGFLYLGSLLMFVRYRQEATRRWYLISLTLAAASLACKEAAATLPLVLLIVDRVIGGAKRPRDQILPHLPFFGLLAGYLMLRTYMLDGIGGYPYLPITASFYLDRLSHLPLLLLREMSAVFPIAWPAASLAGLVLFAYLLIWSPRRLLFYVVLFLVLLAPVVALLGSMVSGPRYLFMPGLAVVIALADAFRTMLRSPSGGTRIAAVLVGLLMASSFLASSMRLAERHATRSEETRRVAETASWTLKSVAPSTTKVFFIYNGWPRTLASLLSLLSNDSPPRPFAVLRPAPYLASWGLAERLSTGEVVKVFVFHEQTMEWEDRSHLALLEIRAHLASRRDPPPILTIQPQRRRIIMRWEGPLKSQPVHLYVGKGDRGIYSEEMPGYRGGYISWLPSPGQYEVAVAYENTTGQESQMGITSVRIETRRTGGHPLIPDHF